MRAKLSTSGCCDRPGAGRSVGGARLDLDVCSAASGSFCGRRPRPAASVFALVSPEAGGAGGGPQGHAVRRRSPMVVGGIAIRGLSRREPPRWMISAGPVLAGAGLQQRMASQSCVTGGGLQKPDGSCRSVVPGIGGVAAGGAPLHPVAQTRLARDWHNAVWSAARSGCWEQKTREMCDDPQMDGNIPQRRMNAKGRPRPAKAYIDKWCWCACGLPGLLSRIGRSGASSNLQLAMG